MTTSNPKKPDPIDIHVGSRIRIARQILSLSQEKLGEALGITFQQVQKYEKGTNRVGASRLLNISAALNRPVEFFFEGLDEAGKPQPLDDTAALLQSKEGMRLAQALAQVKCREARLGLLRAFEEAARLASGASEDTDAALPAERLHALQPSTPVTGTAH